MLASYILMGKALRLMRDRLGAEFPGFEKLAPEAQRHYRKRDGPLKYLREFELAEAQN